MPHHDFVQPAKNVPSYSLHSILSFHPTFSTLFIYSSWRFPSFFSSPLFSISFPFLSFPLFPLHSFLHNWRRNILLALNQLDACRADVTASTALSLCHKSRSISPPSAFVLRRLSHVHVAGLIICGHVNFVAPVMIHCHLLPHKPRLLPWFPWQGKQFALYWVYKPALDLGFGSSHQAM